MKNKACGLMTLALLAAILWQPAALRAQGTAFSYEGQLNTTNGPATGLYDLAFSLYTTNSGGNLVAGPVINRATGVTNGLFSTTIDFGPDMFTGASYWLEVAVQTNGGTAFTTLSPRQSLLPVPYAIFAAGAATATTLSGSLPASQITGTVPLTQIPAGVITNGETGVNFIGTFSGNGIGLTNVPVNSLAWMTNFGVVAWGDNDFAEGTVPPGVTNVAAVSSGYAHTLALLPNGTVTAWGENTAGDTVIPAGLSQVTQVAAGGYHSLALLSGGTVVAWGDNTNGQATVPAGLSNVVAVAAGGYHSLALKRNGTVTAWGQNTDGQTTVPAGLTNVTAVAGGYLYSLALKNNGTVVAWGYNYFGQTSVPAGLSNVVAIAAGSSHALALKSNGTVVAWGDNAAGQATVPAGLSNVVAVAAGAYHSVALLTNGLVVVWGDNSYGQLNLPAGLSNVVAVASGAMAYDVVVIQRQAISPFAALLTAGNNIFPGNLGIGGTMSAVYFSGGGGGLTELNASQLATGTVPLAQLPPQVLTNGESGVTLAGTLTGNLIGNATSAASAGLATNVVSGISITNAFITNSVFAGNGAGLANVSVMAGNIVGTLAASQLSSLVLTNNESGVNLSGTLTGSVRGNATTASLATNVVAGIGITNAFITNSIVAGDGSGLTNVSVKAGNIAGTLAVTQLPAQLLTNGASGVVLTGTVFGALIGNATSATTAASATSAGVASNLAAGVSITNAFITNSVFAGNGAGLINLAYANLIGTPVIPSTNGFVTASVTNGLATTNFVLAQGYLTNANGANAALATNVVSGINITNAFITNSVFAGNGAGLTNLAYANLTGTPIIPATNGFVTAAVTNGLATITFVTTQGYLTNASGANAALATNVVSGISITNAFITNSVFAGDGSALINVNGANITGTLAPAQLPAGLLTNGSPGVILGSDNTGFGQQVLHSLTSGFQNSAFGSGALGSDTTGVGNTALGYLALAANTTGADNIAIGHATLVSNQVANANIAIGADVLFPLQAGFGNTAIGYGAAGSLINGMYNTALGAQALQIMLAGSGNIAIGGSAGLALNAGSNNIYIGNLGAPYETGIIRVGTPGTQMATYLAGAVSAASFAGDGSGLTNLNFAQISGTISPASIGAGSIGSAQLAAGSVTGIQLAPGAVTTTNLAPGAVALGNLQTLPGYQTTATFTDPSPVYAVDANSDFGNAMAAVGSGAVLIGATAQNNYSGLAYLIGANGVLSTTFTNPVATAGPGYFGAAVTAVSSNLVLIGAPEQNEDSGAAYLYNTNGTLLTSFTGPQMGEFFGTAVAALGNDEVAITAPGYAGDTGAVFIYNINGTLLDTITNLTGQNETDFGNSLAIVGSGQLLVGAMYASSGGGLTGGAAYLFDANGSLLTTFTNPGAGNYSEFGESVTAVGPDLVLIGAPAAGPVMLQSGAAYLYTLGGNLVGTFLDPNQNSNDGFGISAVAVGANELLIAASGANNNSGQAYLYNTNGTLLATLSDPAAGGNDYFGSAVAVIGANTLLAGANGVNQGSGAVYLMAPTGNPYVPGLISAGVAPGSITSQSIVSGAVGNGQLANDFIFVNAGTGLTGGGQVSLGSAVYLNNAGVLSVTGDANILATNVAGNVTLMDNSTSANTPGTLVVRDGAGSFSAGQITAAFSGDGSALTGLNASQLAAGTVPLAQLPAAVVTNTASGVTLNNVSLGGTVNYLGSPAGNTALGSGALTAVTSGQQNTAFGAAALAGNTSGGVNTAVGNLALALNKTGLANTAVGDQALNNNTNGSYNTALGVDALANIANGTANVALGYTALTALTNGSSNIVLGSGAGASLANGSSNIYIGNPGTNSEAGVIRIGTSGTQFSTYLAGNVYANAFNMTSDRNAKENFTPVNAGAVLARVAALPVSEWNYKTESQQVQHIGPMAQDFSAAFGLDGRDDKHISVVDEGGVALAAIQGLNQKVEAKDATIEAQSAEIQNLKRQNDELAARLSQLEAAVQALVVKH